MCVGQENAFEHIICEMAAIFSKGIWIKKNTARKAWSALVLL